jgi:hypothetical protein
MKKTKPGYSSIGIDISLQKGNTIKQHLYYKSTGCKYFFCAQHLLINLSNKERSFFDYICEQMDADNAIIINKALKEAYSAFITKICNEELKMTTGILDKALSKFKDKKLLLNLEGGAAYYLVNPRYVFKGKESDRMKLIKKLIENRLIEGLPIDALIDIPVAEFMAGSNIIPDSSQKPLRDNIR